jgi:hypothetical protein
MASFSTCLVRRKLNEIAPPGQLLSECQALLARESFVSLVLLISEAVVGAVGDSERFLAQSFP